MSVTESSMFPFYLKKILTDFRRPLKEPKVPPNTDVIFEKIPLKYEQLESYLLMKKKIKVYNILKSIYDDVSACCGGTNPKFIWDGTLFVLKLFHNKENVLLEHNRELERLFGNVDFATTEKFFKAVKEFKKLFEDDPLYSKLELNDNHKEQDRYYERKTLPSLYISENETNAQVRPPAEAKRLEKELLKRIFKLEQEKLRKHAEKSVKARIKKDEPEEDHKKWLLNLINKYGNPNLEKHADRLIGILKSDRDDTEIQGELVGIIGLENITLAEILLQRRANFKTISNDLLQVTLENESRPALGPQVVFQSKQEKSLAKKLLKLQKKKNNSLDSGLDNDDYELTNKENSRSKRTLPPKIGGSSGVSYPNVYDSQNCNRYAQVSASQLKTSSIPANAIRKDNNVYEEFEIPAHDKPVKLDPDKLIQINSLDRISQVVFNHVTTLNAIQSLVFPIAYATNENMLICAPTGAGKTNTALLAVTHQILQHTTDGVINLRDFKIVYVCPMKALSAEMAANFNRRLRPLGLTVREVTGDMQVSNQELKDAHMIVTTPEKWDIITRKGGTNGFVEIVKLLIIDEVHLLAGDRGPVIEALVARTLRQVESSQKMIRIIGLSATLPNYIDVANFLRVGPKGLFYFDSRFRPVPLKQHFIGVKAERPIEMLNALDNVCFEKVKKFLSDGHQCMVFVHTRNQTGRTANFLKMEAQKAGVAHLFEVKNNPKYNLYKKKLERSTNPLLQQLFAFGLGIHNAGMARTDRDVMEECFREGLIRCLVTTATLAWGVNLPAHGVIIKGTEIYNAAKGGFTDLDMLDVLQIFGRAGRPQFDTSGTAIIITKHEKLYHYMRTLTHQCAIESKFLECLVDNLNAEIVLGTITNEDEGVEWLRYTYLYQRLMANPFAYGVDFNDVQDDVTAVDVRRRFIQTAACDLQQLNMVRYNRQNGDFSATTMGRIASIYYLKYGTVSLFSTFKYDAENDETLFDMMSHATEFTQIKTREDEFKEIDELVNNMLSYNIPKYYGNECAKVNALMQAYISRARIYDPTLISEQAYIVQNVLRVARALFEIGLLRNNSLMAEKCLNVAKMFEQQVWDYETPLRQFSDIPSMTCKKIENQKNMDIERIRDLESKDLEILLRQRRENVSLILRHAQEIPLVEVESTVQPVTRTVIRVILKIKPRFIWNSRFHGPASEHFVMWISDENEILHSETFVFRKKQVLGEVPVQLVFSLRLPERPPTHFIAKISSERWLGSTHNHFISFRGLVLPKCQAQPTNLLTLQPLPISALKKEKFESLYTNFTHFNPIQTQVFFCLYNTDNNVLIGAPTGSGKTIMAEFAILRVLKNNPKQKVVYVAPMKALVRERVEDWVGKFRKLNKTVIEVTGDITPTAQQLNNASIIITTPEKWDSLSRGWQGRNYVQQIALMIIDEIHLLGEERGPVLEVIVSRTNYIAAKTGNKIRLVGLSTSMANAKDLAEWLGIGKFGMFNFRASVRPVPVEVHMGSAPGKHYCPRMKAMNKPVFQSIRLYSPEKPALVFVSSRRQTRLTAQDLITYLGASQNPRQWLHMNEQEISQLVSVIKDPNLKLFLPFGIGTHHAGLEDNDRKITEKLFGEQKIQVLIATATLAWGVNFPAHLVVVKGTEYFDGKKRGYTDMPVTDVLQMVGRAGRPQYDDHGVAVVLVHDIKKNFYKRFLYEPFPIESNLLSVFPDHINAEIVAGTCSTKLKIFEYLTWTFFYQRLAQSPSYYNLRSLDLDEVKDYLYGLIDQTLGVLMDSGCVEYNQEKDKFVSTACGNIASYYYLSHKSIAFFNNSMSSNLSIKNLLLIMSGVYEYSDFPVRHNEEHINEELDEDCRMHPGTAYELAETKVFLLIQAHLSKVAMPIPDYKTDLKMVLQQASRIMQAMIDYTSTKKWLRCTLRIQLIMQMLMQGSWGDDSPFRVMGDIKQDLAEKMEDAWQLCTLSEYGLSWVEILNAYTSKYEEFQDFLRTFLNNSLCAKIEKYLKHLPTVSVKISLVDNSEKKTIPIEVDETEKFKPVLIKQDRRYFVNIELAKNKSSTDAYTPKFTKTNQEGWSIILGCEETDRLISLKRLTPFKRTTSCKIDFEVPKLTGFLQTYTLYILSECYLGLDQEYSFQVKVEQSS